MKLFHGVAHPGSLFLPKPGNVNLGKKRPLTTGGLWETKRYTTSIQCAPALLGGMFTNANYMVLLICPILLRGDMALITRDGGYTDDMGRALRSISSMVGRGF